MSEERTIRMVRPRELIGAAGLVAALVLAMYTFGTERVGLTTDDAGQYARMAQDPTYLARQWYTFRVLTPWLASLWPGDHVVGFTLVTLAGLVLAGTLLYVYGRAVGLGAWASLAGAGLFAVSGGSVRLLTTPVYVDALTYATTAAAFLCLALGRFWLFVLTVSLGVLNRETALLLVPLYVALAWPLREGWRRVAIVIAVPGLVAVLLVVGKLWLGGALTGATSLDALRPAPSAMRQVVPSLTNLFDFFSTFGVLWVLGARRLPGPTPFLRRASLFAAAGVAQLAVARGDEGRVLSHLFPVVIPLAMLALSRAEPLGGRSRAVWGVALVLGAAASMVNARWVFLEPAGLRYALVGGGTAVALVAAWRLGRPATAGSATGAAATSGAIVGGAR